MNQRVLGRDDGEGEVRNSLAQQAYLALEEMLVTLKLAPGSSVREQTLAEQVNLGRTPVREAIQRLAAAGLLKVQPRRGLVVAPLTRNQLAQILEVRRVLERLLAVKAAERASPDQRRALQALAAHLPAAATELESFLRLDQRLDQLLASACRNPVLVQALAPLQVHCRRLWYLNRERLVKGEAADLHAALAGAVADNDGAGAARAVNGIIGLLENLLEESKPLE